MGAPAILKIDIIADATKALKAMGVLEDKASGTGTKLSGMAKGIGAAIGTAAILNFGKQSVNAAQESAVATARLEQVFRSMGDTTGDAAKSAENYAGALSKKIGVDDEAIMAAQAQLATFGAVSNQTARMSGVFDRATAAAADLAAAGFGTLDTNSIQLGKALQDPAKGMTALARSGVTFTAAQKDQIAAMQKSGDLLGAQNVVLKAVESQVGGTAAATATSGAKMAVAYDELQETIGRKLLPTVNALTNFLTNNMSVLIPLGGAILTVVAAVKLYELGTKAAKVAQAAWNVVQIVFNAIMSANPIMLVVLAIAALVGAVILAYTKVGWFRAFVDASFRGIVAAFGWIRDAAVSVFSWVSGHWPLLLAILTGPFGIAVLLITRNFDRIKGVVSGFVDFFRGVWDRVTGIASGIASAMKAPINGFIRGWNAIQFTFPRVDIPSWVPGIGGKGFGGNTIRFPHIPELATGGTVLATGLAVVHRGETFSGVGRAGGTTINVTVNTTGLGAQAPDIQRAVVDALRFYTSRNGPLGAPIVSTAAA